MRKCAECQNEDVVADHKGCDGKYRCYACALVVRWCREKPEVVRGILARETSFAKTS